MQLSEQLNFRIKQYLQSQEFLWSGGEIVEFRMWYRENIGGEFGSSPSCWRDAIIKAAQKENIKRDE